MPGASWMRHKRARWNACIQRNVYGAVLASTAATVQWRPTRKNPKSMPGLAFFCEAKGRCCELCWILCGTRDRAPKIFLDCRKSQHRFLLNNCLVSWPIL